MSQPPSLPVSATLTLRYADGSIRELDIPKGHRIEPAIEYDVDREYDHFNDFSIQRMVRAAYQRLKVTLEVDLGLGPTDPVTLRKTEGTADE